MILFGQIHAGKDSENKTKIWQTAGLFARFSAKLSLPSCASRHELILNPYFQVCSWFSILLAHVYAGIQLIAATMISPDQSKTRHCG